MRELLALSMILAVTSTHALAGKDFHKEDLRHETTRFVELWGQRLSKDKLTFVVHGGNKKLMMIAYKVAQRLDDEGVPVAFLLAPDRDTIDITMHVDYYAKGGSKFGYSAYDNHRTTPEKTEAGLYEWAMKAYEKSFYKTKTSKFTYPEQKVFQYDYTEWLINQPLAICQYLDLMV